MIGLAIGAVFMVGMLFGGLVVLVGDGSPLFGRCGNADRDRCKGKQSRLCFDGLCSRHCREIHAETCGAKS